MAAVPESRDPIGTILMQVHEDLYQLKEKLRKLPPDPKTRTLDTVTVERAIARTEVGLKIHIENYLKLANQNVSTTTVGENVTSLASKWLLPNALDQKSFAFCLEPKGRSGQRQRPISVFPSALPAPKFTSACAAAQFPSAPWRARGVAGCGFSSRGTVTVGV